MEKQSIKQQQKHKFLKKSTNNYNQTFLTYKQQKQMNKDQISNEELQAQIKLLQMFEQRKQQEQSIKAEQQLLKGNQIEMESVFIDTKFGKLHLKKSYPILKDLDNQYLPSIICIHGDGDSWNGQFWKPIMYPLSAEGFTVLALDCPGCGQSQGKKQSYRSYGVEVIEEVVKKLNLQKIILCGESVGGRNTLEFTHKHGKKLVKMMVLTHPVIPSNQILQTISSYKIPTLITWATDDIQHPYNGPHGMKFLQNILNAENLTWTEKNYQDYTLFYEQLYTQNFLKVYNQNYKQK